MPGWQPKPQVIERLFVNLFLDAHDTSPEQFMLDLNATGHPLHGYYHCRCYLPRRLFGGGEAEGLLH